MAAAVGNPAALQAKGTGLGETIRGSSSEFSSFGLALVEHEPLARRPGVGQTAQIVLRGITALSSH